MLSGGIFWEIIRNLVNRGARSGGLICGDQVPARPPCRQTGGDKLSARGNAVLVPSDPLAEPPAIDCATISRDGEQGFAKLWVNELGAAIELLGLAGRAINDLTHGDAIITDHRVPLFEHGGERFKLRVGPAHVLHRPARIGLTQPDQRIVHPSRPFGERAKRRGLFGAASDMKGAQDREGGGDVIIPSGCNFRYGVALKGP